MLGRTVSSRILMALSRSVLCLAVAAPLALAAGHALAQNNTEQDQLAAEIKKQLRRLADRELAERERAEQELIQLGAAALELLPTVTDRMPEEMKLRLGRIRTKLEKLQGEAAREGSRLTLAAAEMSLADFIEAVGKQTSNQLIDMREEFGQVGEPKKLETGTHKQAEFWPVVDAALDKANLTTYPYRDDGKLGIVARLPMQTPRSQAAVYHGPFRIEPLKTVAQRNLRQGADGSGSLDVTLEIAWEPRLAPISVQVPLDALKVEDDRGRAIAPLGKGVSLENNVRSNSKALELSLPLTLPPRDAARLSTLRGKLQVLLPGRTEAFRFDDLDKAAMVVQRRGGVVVTLDAVRQNNDLWQAFLRVRFDEAGAALESYRGWYYQNECYLLDANGKRIDYAAFDRTRETENEFGLGYLFDVPQGLKGLTLVYHTPVMILDVPVEFELNDLPLP